MKQTVTTRFSPYDDTERMRKYVHNRQHRAVVGGLWEELGTLQSEFLKRRGLQPHHALIDVGAGSFRAGVKLVPYLDSGNYYAIDIQQSLLQAGYDREIVPAGLGERFRRSHFAATSDFDTQPFERNFDFGIAQSVFTHMPLARLADCLAALAPQFRPGGQFYVTLFLVPDGQAGRPATQMPGGVVTTATQDPFHTTKAALHDLAFATRSWKISSIGHWGHPRNQQMVCFQRSGEQ